MRPAYIDVDRVCPGCSASMIAGRAAQFRSIIDEHEQAMYRLLNQTRNTDRDAVIQEITDREKVDNKLFDKTKAYGDLAAEVITDFQNTWNDRVCDTDWVNGMGEGEANVGPYPSQEGLAVQMASETDEMEEIEWQDELYGYEEDGGIPLQPDEPEGIQDEVVPDENLFDSSTSPTASSSSSSSSPSSTSPASIAFTHHDDDAVWNFAP